MNNKLYYLTTNSAAERTTALHTLVAAGGSIHGEGMPVKDFDKVHPFTQYPVIVVDSDNREIAGYPCLPVYIHNPTECSLGDMVDYLREQTNAPDDITVGEVARRVAHIRADKTIKVGCKTLSFADVKKLGELLDNPPEAPFAKYYLGPFESKEQWEGTVRTLYALGVKYSGHKTADDYLSRAAYGRWAYLGVWLCPSGWYFGGNERAHDHTPVSLPELANLVAKDVAPRKVKTRVGPLGVVIDHDASSIHIPSENETISFNKAREVIAAVKDMESQLV